MTKVSLNLIMYLIYKNELPFYHSIHLTLLYGRFPLQSQRPFYIFVEKNHDHVHEFWRNRKVTSQNDHLLHYFLYLQTINSTCLFLVFSIHL